MGVQPVAVVVVVVVVAAGSQKECAVTKLHGCAPQRRAAARHVEGKQDPQRQDRPIAELSKIYRVQSGGLLASQAHKRVADDQFAHASTSASTEVAQDVKLHETGRPT